MRITIPEGGMSLFDWQPELFATFNLFYGVLWSEGVARPAHQRGRSDTQCTRGRLRYLTEPSLCRCKAAGSRGNARRADRR